MTLAKLLNVIYEVGGTNTTYLLELLGGLNGMTICKSLSTFSRKGSYIFRRLIFYSIHVSNETFCFGG